MPGIMAPKAKKRVNNKSTGRDYKAEQKYDGSPIVKKKRAMRNAARRAMMKAGKVKKGDGMDVDHINSNPFDNNPKNWRVRKASDNRSYPRTKNAREKKRPGIMTANVPK